MQRIKTYWIVIFIVAFILCMFTKPILCLLILGGIVFYVGIYAIRFQRKVTNNGIECTGRILSFETDSDGDKTPVIEFTPIGGMPITGKPFIHTSMDAERLLSYKDLIGTKVLIIYDPDDPIKFILGERKGLNNFVFVLLILAGLVAIVVVIADLAGYIKLG